MVIINHIRRNTVEPATQRAVRGPSLAHGGEKACEDVTGQIFGHVAIADTKRDIAKDWLIVQVVYLSQCVHVELAGPVKQSEFVVHDRISTMPGW